VKPKSWRVLTPEETQIAKFGGLGTKMGTSVAKQHAARCRFVPMPIEFPIIGKIGR
jgi:hypothetical protein